MLNIKKLVNTSTLCVIAFIENISNADFESISVIFKGKNQEFLQNHSQIIRQYIYLKSLDSPHKVFNFYNKFSERTYTYLYEHHEEQILATANFQNSFSWVETPCTLIENIIEKLLSEANIKSRAKNLLFFIMHNKGKVGNYDPLPKELLPEAEQIKLDEIIKEYLK